MRAVGRIRALFGSVSVRLLLGVWITIAVSSAIFVYVQLRSTSSEWMQVMRDSAGRTSELVRRAAHHGMLLNRKEDVQQTLRQLGRSPGVAGIRVYDKNGVVMFSANEAELGQKADRKAEACTMCHEVEGPLRRPQAPGLARNFRRADGSGILGVITPIENRPECSSASCHAHPRSQTILGVLDVQMSTTFVDDTQRRTSREFVWAMVLLALFMGLGSTLFIQRVVRGPVRLLHESTMRVAAGDLDTRIETRTQDELGQLAGAFNRMTEELRRARDERMNWSTTLERRVQEKTEALEKAQDHLIHMEKMASVGKLAAVVAHELNNPLAGILTYAKLVGRELAEGPPPPETLTEIQRYLSLIQSESSRCGGIVHNLLSFSRRGSMTSAPAHLHEILERALLLVRHQLELAGVRVERAPASGDDALLCDANQLGQAIVALLVNAVEGMSGVAEPVLTLGVRAVGGALELSIRDNGCGIAPEIMPHIFEPFFTSKIGGNGVGLGLAVVYGIVQRHGGTIEVDSEVGQGACFRIRLPSLPAPLPEPLPAVEPQTRTP